MDHKNVRGGLQTNTKLYRYIGIEQFLSIVENRQMSLTRIVSWDDTHEIPIRKRILDATGSKEAVIFVDNFFGQCWSTLEESDAMWRIYSPQKSGLMLETSVKKFDLVDGLNNAFLAPVTYSDETSKGIETAKLMLPEWTQLAAAFVKRCAFEHEREVRLLADMSETAICAPDSLKPACKYVPFDISDVLAFIEQVVVDPRASDWYVETIGRYCARAGLTCEVRKSQLYAPPP